MPTIIDGKKISTTIRYNLRIMNVVKTFILLYALLGASSLCAQKSDEIIWDAPIVGNDGGAHNSPNIILQPEIRRKILIAFHRGESIKQIQKETKQPEEAIQKEIDHLFETSMLTMVEGKPRPFMLVILPEDISQISKFTNTLAKQIDSLLFINWFRIDSIVAGTSIGKRFDRKRILFQVVGCELLDFGMLDAFYQDSVLMPPPPKRSVGQYYAWYEQGPKKIMEPLSIGYGKTQSRIVSGNVKYYPCVFSPSPKQTRLRRPIFQKENGEWWTDAQKSKYLTSYDKYYQDSMCSLDNETRNYLLQAGYITNDGQCLAPIYYEDEKSIIDSLIICPITEDILKLFKAKHNDFRKAYLKTGAGKYPSEQGLSTFICRILHLVYDVCIIELMKKELITPTLESDSEFWLEKYTNR